MVCLSLAGKKARSVLLLVWVAYGPLSVLGLQSAGYENVFLAPEKSGAEEREEVEKIKELVRQDYEKLREVPAETLERVGAELAMAALAASEQRGEDRDFLTLRRFIVKQMPEHQGRGNKQVMLALYARNADPTCWPSYLKEDRFTLPLVASV